MKWMFDFFFHSFSLSIRYFYLGFEIQATSRFSSCQSLCGERSILKKSKNKTAKFTNFLPQAETSDEAHVWESVGRSSCPAEVRRNLHKICKGERGKGEEKERGNLNSGGRERESERKCMCFEFAEARESLGSEQKNK